MTGVCDIDRYRTRFDVRYFQVFSFCKEGDPCVLIVGKSAVPDTASRHIRYTAFHS